MRASRLPAEQLLSALAKLGLALRHDAWQRSTRRRLTPTQSQALACLSRGHGPRLGELARELAVTGATASDAVATLVRKGLVRKRRVASDERALRLELTAAGRREAERAREWPEAFLASAEGLSAEEQGVLLRTLMKIVRRLQLEGRIPIARMCATCTFFRPHLHADVARPHHCDFLDAAFGERELRIECSDHELAEPARLQATWERFASGGSTS